ncbi:MAG TPA: class I SAM-dependent methyltransferase [Kiritimatiellia bacterium]|nr:class I SAM-dependent methyltransferase [Kiritimatiellia bacterium]
MPKGNSKNRLNAPPICHDKHALYEAAVQEVDDDINFMRRTFKRHRARPLRFLREDFCGTAKLSARWVSMHPEHRAMGVDIDPEPLDWGLRHHVHQAGEAGKRLKLVRADALMCRRPAAEAICAFNFSYFLFKTRENLRAYFASARKSLQKDGMLFMDAFGGLQAMTTNKDVRSIPDARDAFGNPMATFIYEWEHAHFDVLTHNLDCHIHFELNDGTRLDRAFTYNWRLWTLPEVREILFEAGFDRVEIYTHGWDSEGQSDNTWRLRKHYENEDGWLAYIVGIKDGR